jgi:hypothetical protein
MVVTYQAFKIIVSDSEWPTSHLTVNQNKAPLNRVASAAAVEIEAARTKKVTYAKPYDQARQGS